MSAACLYAALRGVSWPLLAQNLASAHYAWLVPAGAAVVLGQWLRGWRWRALFGAQARPAFGDALAILSVGYLVSAVLPLRLGDPARAWLMRHRSGAGGYEAFATVMAERALDFLTLAALLVLWVPRLASRLLTERLGSGVWSNATALTAIGLAGLAAVYLAMVAFGRAGPTAIDRAVGRWSRLGLPSAFVGRLGTAVARFALGFRPLGERRTGLVVAIASLCVWLVGASSYWLVMQAFDLHLGYSAALFAMCGTGLMAVLPSSPGYAGVFHLGVRVALGLIDPTLGPDQVQAFAIVLHGYSILILIVLGALGMVYLGLDRGDLARGLMAMGPDES